MRTAYVTTQQYHTRVHIFTALQVVSEQVLIGHVVVRKPPVFMRDVWFGMARTAGLSFESTAAVVTAVSASSDIAPYY